MVLGEMVRRVVVTNNNALLLLFCLQLHFKSGDNRPPFCALHAFNVAYLVCVITQQGFVVRNPWILSVDV